MLFCLYCLSAEIASPHPSAVSACVFIANIYTDDFFGWTTQDKLFKLSLTRYPFSHSPELPVSACFSLFFFLLLKTDDCFGSVPNDVSPAACYTTTSNFLHLLETSSVTVSQEHIHLIQSCTTPVFLLLYVPQGKQEGVHMESWQNLMLQHKNGRDLPRVWA